MTRTVQILLAMLAAVLVFFGAVVFLMLRHQGAI